MKRDGLICWYREWDKSGKVVRELWRPINAPDAPPPAAKKPKIERGIRRPPKVEQDRLL